MSVESIARMRDVLTKYVDRRLRRRRPEQLDAGLARIIDDSRGYYLVGFETALVTRFQLAMFRPDGHLSEAGYRAIEAYAVPRFESWLHAPVAVHASHAHAAIYP